eukprot:TRINITY_DN10505_c0_g1_i2.p1 TRINITY_DN10505_c0_g1~~TRINITY_DN10505_c0_g1_i2.p1  ORF type:complete len:589 (-),score=89.15 TRINITY_DN10505_c0_g1_i2:11-1777(-)
MKSLQVDRLEKLVAQWVQWDPNDTTKNEIVKLWDAEDYAEIEKRLSSRISFGTAGLRGKMTAGYNFINDLTIIQTTQGLCVYLEKMSNKAKGVCIGYDGRHNSKHYAEITAAIFMSRGFPVYLFRKIIPTPILAYCVKSKHCSGGIMITASHNPKDDNGYKVYWSNGCQIIEPHDKGITDCIILNFEPWGVDLSGVYSNPLLKDPTDEVINSYFEALKVWSFKSEENSKSKFRAVYTPLHGVGGPFMERALQAFGLPPFIPTKEQMESDPEFPTVPFPNPEEKGALKAAIKAADEAKVNLIISNDPDADRLGVAERLPDGTWKMLHGNEVGILLAHWIFIQKKQKVLPEVVDYCKWFVLNTTVSSKMLAAMAKKEGLHYDETLTGFKYLGSLSLELTSKGYTPLIAFEEAIGYMIGDMVSDKDGVLAAAVFLEMATHLYANNLTCFKQLDELHKLYGYFLSNNHYFFCHDPAVMATIFSDIRNGGKYHEKCGRFVIQNVRDLTTGYDSTQPDKKAVLPISGVHMITFYFDNGAVATLRGSGTEPKLKYYIELGGEDRKATEAELTELVKEVIDNFLQPTKYGLGVAAE